MPTSTPCPPAEGQGGADTPDEELFKSALDASQSGRSSEAIDSWRSFLRRHPAHPHAHYLLAAELAQERQYSDAVVHFSMALEHAPDFVPARFQLGLLWLTMNAPSQAVSVLQPLQELPETVPYRHFAAALSHLSSGNVAHAHAALTAGLALPNENQALVADMKLLQERVAASQALSESLPEDVEARHGLAMSAYEKAKTRH